MPYALGSMAFFAIFAWRFTPSFVREIRALPELGEAVLGQFTGATLSLKVWLNVLTSAFFLGVTPLLAWRLVRPLAKALVRRRNTCDDESR